MKRRSFYIFLSAAVLALSAFAAPAQTPTYLLDGKPVSEQVYQAGLLINLGIELGNANRLIEAKQKLTEAVRIAPDFPDAHYNLGVVLVRLGEEAVAAKHFEFVVVSRANFPMAWLMLGQIWVGQRKYREAVNAFVDALKRYPEQMWQDHPPPFTSTTASRWRSSVNWIKPSFSSNSLSAAKAPRLTRG